MAQKIDKGLTITHNQPVCYCQKKFKKLNGNWNNYTCRNCWEVYENIRQIYWCGNDDECKYKNITDRPYDICLDCYNLMKIYNNNNINDIVSKIERQINILSYIILKYIYFYPFLQYV